MGLDAKRERRDFVGIGGRKFQFKRAVIHESAADQLRGFREPDWTLGGFAETAHADTIAAREAC